MRACTRVGAFAILFSDKKSWRIITPDVGRAKEKTKNVILFGGLKVNVYFCGRFM